MAAICEVLATDGVPTSKAPSGPREATTFPASVENNNTLGVISVTPTTPSAAAQMFKPKISAGHNLLPTCLDIDPAVLSHTFQYFFEKNHPAQPVFECRIVHWGRTVGNLRVKALENLLVRIVVAHAVTTEKI